MFDRVDEPIDGTVARIEIIGGEEQHVVTGGFSDYHRRLSAGRGANLVRLIVAVEGVERRKRR